MKNFQSLKPKIEILIEPVLAKEHLKVYELNNFQDSGSDVLQLLVEDLTNPQKVFDLDFIVKISEEISGLLDQLETEISGNYLFEVASAGIERKIKTEAELSRNLGNYVFVELLKPTKDKPVEFNATVENYDPETRIFNLTYFIKGQKKKGQFLFSDFKTIRYAVKF